MKPDNVQRILFTGGGTGGHIYPAVAIAREVQKLAPDTEILFVGALGKMEMEKVPRAGFKIVGLPVTAFHRSLTMKNLLFPYKLLMSLVKARKIVRDFNPDLVVGTGGFASGPVLRVSTQKHLPVILQEQNAFPGVTNRLVAGKVNHICVAYPGMEKYFPKDKIVVTGNPVRTDLVLPADRLAAAFGSFGFSCEVPVILVIGGSLGARTLNHCMAAAAGRLAAAPVQIIWQTGTNFVAEAKASVEKADAKNIRVHDFIYNMDEAYAIASLAVCRSGAITLSELAVVGKPALLVPFPAAAEDHQTKNAKVFTEAGAAQMISDAEAGNKMINKMMELIDDKRALAEMAKNMTALAKPDATHTIADLALKLLNRKP